MKGKLKGSTIVMIICCILGLAALLYPTVSDYWNENYTTRAISNYAKAIGDVTDEKYKQEWEDAVAYNEELRKTVTGFRLPGELRERYESLLNVTDTGLIGYIEIPKIDVQLSLYHGVSDAVLKKSVGHLDWSSLPTGGLGTHCVLSGHRGLPSARLFTDLDDLREGDTFLLYILNETLTYEVDQIRTVEPSDVSTLAIDKDRDYCTLVTCTPYGINTHRLLVRGHRIENALNCRVISEAVIVDELLVASFLAVPILFALVMVVMVKRPQSQRKNKNNPNTDPNHGGGNHEKDE